MRIEELYISAHPPFPNSIIPVLLYREVFVRDTVTPERFEDCFFGNGWTVQWRNGVYSFHHFHSTAHEVLGFYSGEARLQVGGPSGPELTVYAGDAVLLPAGTGHCNLRQSGDFACVGAYATGSEVDLLRGNDEQYEVAVRRAAAVPAIQKDPVTGQLSGDSNQG